MLTVVRSANYRARSASARISREKKLFAVQNMSKIRTNHKFFNIFVNISQILNNFGETTMFQSTLKLIFFAKKAVVYYFSWTLFQNLDFVSPCRRVTLARMIIICRKSYFPSFCDNQLNFTTAKIRGLSHLGTARFSLDPPHFEDEPRKFWFSFADANCRKTEA